MTVIAYPMNASGGAPVYTARQGRQVLAALMVTAGSPGGPTGTRSGFRPGIGRPSVTVDSTTWSVGRFSALIDPRQSTTQGPYLVTSDTTETGSMTPADGTFARKDILYIQVDDADEDATGQRRARVLYQAGVPGSSPSAPATPVRSLLVATIDVPKVGSGAPSSTRSNLWTVAAGGVLPFSAIAPVPGAERYTGMVLYNEDTDQLQVWTAGAATRTIWDNALPTIYQSDYTLAENWYGVGQPFTIRSNTSNARADVDAAMTLTFTAPDTGRVWIELEGFAASTGVTAGSGVFGTYWCLRNTADSSLVANSSLPMLPTQDTNATRLRYSTKVTGLTPGQSYTYAWQHFRGTGATGTAWWYIGGGITALMRARRCI